MTASILTLFKEMARCSTPMGFEGEVAKSVPLLKRPNDLTGADLHDF